MNSCYIHSYRIFAYVYVYSYTFAESVTKEINKQVGKNRIFYTQNLTKNIACAYSERFLAYAEIYGIPEFLY